MLLNYDRLLLRIENRKQYQKKYLKLLKENHPETYLKYQNRKKEWEKTHLKERRKYKREWMRNYRHKNPLWIKRHTKRKTPILARRIVRAMVIKGTLISPDECERCGYKIKLHAHHEDYARLSDVIWLCPNCHYERHQQLKSDNYPLWGIF